MAPLIALAVPLVLALLIVTTLLPLLTRWVHPIRTFTIALSCGFTLLLLSLITPLVGVSAWIWGALVLLALVAVAVACRRALRAPAPEVHEPAGSRRERRRAKRIRRLAARPSWGETGTSACLFIALVVAASLAG